jgi:predicted kinase
MMNKIQLSKPALIALYGYPGSGKTHFARQLCDTIGTAHIQGDRIRYELFERPRYDKQENEVVTHLMEYMAEEFLNAGVSVVFDINAMRLVQRRALRDMARKSHAVPLLVWLQIDAESAYLRASQRDRRKNDDKFAMPMDQETFERLTGTMQNPNNEDYTVISGKHTFNAQRSAIMKKLYDLGLVGADIATNSVIKPGLVNLVPNMVGGRVDISRRNIVIR